MGRNKGFCYTGIQALFDEKSRNPKLIRRGKLPATRGKRVWVSPQHLAIFRIFQLKLSIFRPKFSLYNDTMMRASRR